MDVVIGGLGLIAAALMAFVIASLIWFIAVVQWVTFFLEGDFSVAPGLAETSGVILGSCAVALVSTFADACLFATGLQLLDRSPNARRSAFLFAVAIVPLGAIDVVIAQHAGSARVLVLAFVLPLPIYSIAQLAAFFVLPSWRALTTGSATRSTS